MPLTKWNCRSGVKKRDILSVVLYNLVVARFLVYVYFVSSAKGLKLNYLYYNIFILIFAINVFYVYFKVAQKN